MVGGRSNERGAALRIVVEGKAGARTLQLQDANGLPTATADLDEGELTVVNSRLREALTDLHDLAGDDLTLDTGTTRDAVSTLVELAKRLRYPLHRGGILSSFYDATSAFAETARNPAAPVRIVEIQAPQDFQFPFELFPWYPIDSDEKDPSLKVRSLLGMSAVVRRLTTGQGGAVTTVIQNEPALPLTVFAHPDFPATLDEATYFDRANGLVDLYGPWPVHVPGSTSWQDFSESALVDYVLNPHKGLDGLDRCVPPSVVHFACHCDTHDTNPDKHTIDVGSELDIQNSTFDLGSLKSRVPDRTFPATSALPLMFLNGCGTATFGPGRFEPSSSKASFADFFVIERYAGVIGTLADISDTVAAHYSMVFYEHLLRGSTIGEAMYAARWHLIERHGNPLGLLYTFFGNPDLAVAHPRAGEVIPACAQTS